MTIPEYTGPPGGIFKLTHGTPPILAPFDLTKLPVAELVKLHSHANEWWVRQARLELTARAAGGKDLTGAVEALRDGFSRESCTVAQLRALWTLYGMGELDPAFLTAQLRHPDEAIRTWAIRLLTDDWPLDTVLSQRPAGRAEAVPDESVLVEFQRLAREDSSGLVRLALASTLQRLPVAQRPRLAAPLLARAEDAGDHNLPLMLWYGLIPVAAHDPAALAGLAVGCELPVTRQCIARRLAEELGRNPAPLNALLTLTGGKSAAFQSDILSGMAAGLNGWRKAPKPEAWDQLASTLQQSTEAGLRARVRNLSVLFGDGLALDAVRQIATDDKAELSARRAALQTLIDHRHPDLRAVCEQLLGVRFLNGMAARGLALFDDPAIGQNLAKRYRSFAAPERPMVIETLVSRPSFASSLLTELASGTIARQDITPFHARQIRSFNDPALSLKLKETWGEVRDSTADKRRLIDSLKKQLTPAALAKADPSMGRVLFQNLCGTCHLLYGQGTALGPDLTGSGRDNLDYLLENIADPGTVVGADFRMTVVTLQDGRVLNGFVSAKTGRTLTLRTMTESVTMERTEVLRLEESSLSLMPEGLLSALDETQSRDLIAYLMSRSQVPLPDGKK